MKLDGQLQNAQLEEVGSAAPSPAVRSRIYSDITDTTAILPRFFDGSKFVQLAMRKRSLKARASGFVLTQLDDLVQADATAGQVAYTLPAASAMPGELLYVIKTDTTFNTVVLNRAGSDTIDGATTLQLSTYREWVIIISTGTGWTVLQWDYYRGKLAFTPTGSWVSNTTYAGYWWRDGNRINFDVTLTLTGAPTSAALTLSMPAGTSVDSSVMSSTLASFLTSGRAIDADGNNFAMMAIYNSTSLISLQTSAATVVNITQAAPFTFAAGDFISFQVKDIPIPGWRG